MVKMAINLVSLESYRHKLSNEPIKYRFYFHLCSKIAKTLPLANTYYRDEARVINAPTMVSGDWQKFMPNVKPGDVAASPLNPICWPIKNKP